MLLGELLMRALVIVVIAGACCSLAPAQTVSPLFARGYTVTPEPQKVSLEASDFTFNQSWHLKLDHGVSKGDVAVDTLREDLDSRFNIQLWTRRAADGILTLRIQPGSVSIGAASDSKKSLEEQAY
jgi:hypothetical protein